MFKLEISSLQFLQPDETELQWISNPMNKYFDVNSASVRVMFNPDSFFPFTFSQCCFEVCFFCSEIFFVTKAVESELFFFFFPPFLEKVFSFKRNI